MSQNLALKVPPTIEIAGKWSSRIYAALGTGLGLGLIALGGVGAIAWSGFLLWLLSKGVLSLIG
jgi:hypothetical protein